MRAPARRRTLSQDLVGRYVPGAVLAAAGAVSIVLGLHQPLSPPARADPVLPAPASPSGAGDDPGRADAVLPVPGSPSGVGDDPGRADAVLPVPGSPAGAADDPALSRSVPTRLSIPAIGVDTRLMRLGIRRDRTVQVPPLSRDAPAGWYERSVTPGERGAAVILGHVDSARDGPAVFYRLGALHPGDRIGVGRADGSTARFVVTAVATYPKAAFPTGLVYGPAEYPALRLVTCGGTFDRARRSYRASIVVYARLA
ncbi:class F sortase [Actinoplanes sp. N902-109]|uniref:class F sortase n=1 Tax=Actinoplanes sp. (strain N902-109) TaxID=649831 RepID=UPI00032938A2|nr:class F sortase [Actinoplanes sp. N902-109]AGL17320.1 peptidase C60, sortase A and B [Actinoplanes sp. N902-109]